MSSRSRYVAVPPSRDAGIRLDMLRLFSSRRRVARPNTPHVQSPAKRAGRIRKWIHQLGMFAFAVMLACTIIGSRRPTAAGQLDVDVTIREMMPTPVRCNRTTEPLFYCRHDNAADHTMVLELASGTDGPAASLTYDYDDAKRHELFAVMRRFFVRTGVPPEAFDECILQSQWKPNYSSKDGWQVLCFRVELGDRVTNEVFAMAEVKAPVLLHAREGGP